MSALSYVITAAQLEERRAGRVVDMSRWCVPSIEVDIEPDPECPRSRTRILVTLQVRNVETGQMGPLISTAYVENYRLEGPDRDALIYHLVLNALKVAVFHEIEETLHIHGVRPCTPHPDRGAR